LPTLTVNANGTITVVPRAAGTLTFTYTVADDAGLRSAPTTVTVLITLPETLSVSLADYTQRSPRYSLRGLTTQPGNTITACAALTAAACTTANTIGSAVADNTGAWTIQVNVTAALAPVRNAQGQSVISFRSSGGAVLNGVIVRLR
jgi:hypothetical protein